MYRKRGYRSSQRRREELRSYLCRIVTGLSIVCIIIVCAAVAVKTRKAWRRPRRRCSPVP